jgi:hypothetical protein
MTDRALQKYETLWIHFDEIDPDDEETDFRTNLQVGLSLEHPGFFTFTAIDKQSGEIVCHNVSLPVLMDLANWIKSGGR